MDVEATYPPIYRMPYHTPRLPCDAAASPWHVVHELIGRIRLKHPALHRHREFCWAIERDLLSVLGVDNCQANPLTGTILVKYSPQKLRRDQVIEILDSALLRASIPKNGEAGETSAPQSRTPRDTAFPLCMASVPLAAVAQFAVPMLLPISAGLLLYTSIPSFKGAYRAVVKEKRLGGEVLDSIVAAGCLATGAVFAGSVLCLCLGLGQVVSRKSQNDSKKLLLSEFGKLPRFARLWQKTGAIETLVDELRPGDLIVVQSGDVVPVDGILRAGDAVLDQRALTGSATPAEKGIGDRVFASTVLICGKAVIAVESSRNETLSAGIGQLLNRAASYQLLSQRKRERFADRAVLPTLALAGTAMATVGPAGAMAVIYCDLRTGVRLAAPLAMLSSVALCANRGILVKDGRALELMNRVDTVLLDMTALPCGDFSEVHRVIAGLRKRGIKLCAVVSSERQALVPAQAGHLPWDEYFVGVSQSDKVDVIERLRQAGRKVCFIGDGLCDSLAVQTADVSISLSGIDSLAIDSLAADAAEIVFLNQGLEQLCELRDIASRLDRNVNRSWTLIMVPNLLCVAGAFTMGFGVLASMVMNSAGALAALCNGMAPLRRVAQERLEQDLVEELRDMYRPQSEQPRHAEVIETECVETAT